MIIFDVKYYTIMVIADITQNFARIYRTLEDQGSKPTNLAKMIGYTTTAQLHSALEGTSILSTKAIWAMVEKLNVNPLYLFLGRGQMFFDESDEDLVNQLRIENQALKDQVETFLDRAAILEGRVKEMEKSNSDLIEMSVAGMKYYKSMYEETLKNSLDNETKISDTK